MAPSLTAINRLVINTPPYQIRARTEGEPALGVGAIYPIDEAEITVPDRPIPDSWPRAFGMDVGWNRTAAPDQEDAPTIDCRFAEVEYLEELGMGRTAFEVYLGEKPACEVIGFDHEFNPAAHVPAPVF